MKFSIPVDHTFSFPISQLVRTRNVREDKALIINLLANIVEVNRYMLHVTVKNVVLTYVGDTKVVTENCR